MSQSPTGQLVAIVGRDVKLAGTKPVEWPDLHDFESFDNFNAVVLDFSTLSKAGVVAADVLRPRASEISRILGSGDYDAPGLVVFGWDDSLESILDIVPRALRQNITNFTTQSNHPELTSWVNSVDDVEVGFDDFKPNPGLTRQRLPVRAVADEKIAKTPSGLLVSLAYYLTNVPEDPLESLLQRDEFWASRTVLVLPEGPSRSLDSAFKDVIRSVFSLKATEVEPEWLSELPDTPQQTNAKKRVARLVALRSRVDEKLDNAAAEESHAARFRRLFSESGKELVAIVDDALEALGAACTYPKASNRVDAKVFAPDGTKFATEIKGVNRNVNEDDFRQLRTWVDELNDAEPDVDWQGLLIMNTFRASAPSNRDHPIHPNVIKKFQRYNFRFLTTARIYQTLIAQGKADFDPMAWWASLEPPS